MAAANTVTLTFAGDSRSLDRTFANVDDGLKDVGDALDDASQKSRRFGGGVDDIADRIGSSEEKFTGINDLIGGFADTVGLALPEQFAMVQGFADMASGASTLLAPALAKAGSAQKLLNTAMRSNPIGLVVTALVVLTAAFVVAYKKSETFRNIVNGALDGVKQVAYALRDAFVAVGDRIAGVFDFIADKARWLWDHSPLGMIVNNLGKIGGVLGSIGGAIPGFASGGQTNGGLSVVGERGPELFAGKGTIIPNGRIGIGGGGETRVVLEFQSNGDPIMDAFAKQIRVRGGVRAALNGGRAL